MYKYGGEHNVVPNKLNFIKFKIGLFQKEESEENEKLATEKKYS